MSDDFEGREQLENAYQRAAPDSFGLYLGAGVNLHPEGKDTPKKHFNTYCWRQLLEALYKKNKERLTDSFADLWDRYKNDWLGLASELVGPLGVETFVEQMDDIIHDDIPRKDSYGRLSKRLLDQAPTLRAAICFSAKIRQRTETSWTFERNPKIGTVITFNYDFFFGAGWTRYQAFDKYWKVQTPFSEGKPDPEQRTINYIHGYVPYKFSKKKDLVLTQASYDDAYAPDGFASRTLREAINGYNLIFLGTSLSDKPLCKMLKKYRGKRQHFAIVKSDTEAVERVNQLGICPVVVRSYSEIAVVLEEIYCAALDTAECQRVGLANPKFYWKRLGAGPVKSRQKKQE